MIMETGTGPTEHDDANKAPSVHAAGRNSLSEGDGNPPTPPRGAGGRCGSRIAHESGVVIHDPERGSISLDDLADDALLDLNALTPDHYRLAADGHYRERDEPDDHDRFAGQAMTDPAVRWAYHQAAFERGVAEGRCQATEGWEREEQWAISYTLNGDPCEPAHGGHVFDSREEAERHLDAWRRFYPDLTYADEVYHRRELLTGPWEPAEQTQDGAR